MQYYMSRSLFLSLVCVLANREKPHCERNPQLFSILLASQTRMFSGHRVHGKEQFQKLKNLASGVQKDTNTLDISGVAAYSSNEEEKKKDIVFELTRVSNIMGKVDIGAGPGRK
ncbi:hypothetical protein F5Y14DRAFT_252655 [Nemania sp. NC0429]|nr:hypothetical protein F5Y14DRAFT_252655 [Nemania sp. NC0429]